MTVKQAIFTLAPTLERIKKRGFDTQEIVERLHEKGIEVKPQTLTKYLTEARRQREDRNQEERHAPPPPRLSNAAASLLLIYRLTLAWSMRFLLFVTVTTWNLITFSYYRITESKNPIDVLNIQSN